MFSRRWLATALLVACTFVPSAVHATDVDGPNDCLRVPVDFGDAPEGAFAYPAVPGCFPTCLAPGPVGTQSLACPPISTAPGATGFVRHAHIAADTQYWLGCIPTNQGIDSEPDGKMNATGAAVSACATGLAVDCFEAAFGLTFGQDECYGGTDATLATAVNFAPCDPTSSLTFNVWNCGQARQIYVNVLVDWNQDGDWNDIVGCPGGGCAFEWVAKNLVFTITTGCTPITLPAFMSGPNVGDGWMRITIDDGPVPDDFPWAGSANMPNNLRNGETEDYPVTISHNDPECPDYEDWGDAPEEVPAYFSGVAGRFPTCAFFAPPGTRSLACAPISTVPGPTGYVRHVSTPEDPLKFWLGCGSAALGTSGVDSEFNGKMNSTGGAASVCDPLIGVDCVEPAFGMSFGQDECYADPPGDAGVIAPVVFTGCATSNVTFYANNCTPTTIQVYLNILVDWNEDGDWNDNFLCGATACSYEWAVKNVLIALPPGCLPQVSPAFLAGPFARDGWMRITLTPVPVTDDFPWRGSAATTGLDYYRGGETEDYPVKITSPPDTCDTPYRDFGDAPEGFDAYAGILGRFPTCITPTLPGDQDVECAAALSTPPATTGYVEHIATAADDTHFYLGCAVDDESDGKTNLGGAAGSVTFCSAAGPTVDCGEGGAWGGALYGQDECYGDADAALGALISSSICSDLTIRYRATLCENGEQVAYLNILADWNRDGDWNDNVICKEDACSVEWPVKNVAVLLAPGCNFYTAPPIFTGPFVGEVWTRFTLSRTPAPDDFPWNGTVTSGAFNGGETEDYRIRLTPFTSNVPEHGARGLWLGPAIPNPARDRVDLDFGLPRAADVSLAVYDLLGRRIALIESGTLEAGPHHAGWNFRDADGHDVPVGSYVLKLRVGSEVLTRRVIRVK